METVVQSSLVLDRTTLLLTACAVALSVLWWISTRRPKGLPPGPGPALPLLGHMHLIEKDPRAKFREWRKRYGDVFSLYIGHRLVVVLNGLAAINEALVKTADAFSDRPHMLIAELAKSKGIVLSSGDQWKEQRKTGLEILRKMGMGKDCLASKIQEEVAHYVQQVAQHQGAPMDFHWITHASVSNNICAIVFGQRYNYDDTTFLSFIEEVTELAEKLEGGALMTFFPMLAKLPGNLFGAKEIVASNERLEDQFLKPHIEQHKKKMRDDDDDDDNEDDNFVDAYLRKMKTLSDSGKATTLDDGNLLRCTFDLFGAGTETTATTILWAMLHLLHHPEVQNRCYNEICDVIGTQRLPCMRDKPEMTYMEATINEIQRIAPLVPASLQHRIAYDVKFRDYVLPKGAIVCPMLESVLMAPEIWGDPENFRPERFIGSDGKVTKPEGFIPFGTGRRLCLGESLARMELFLYITALVQNFQLLPADPDHLPSLEGVFGITCSPQHFKIRAVPRK